jgi:uncharacterized protein
MVINEKNKADFGLKNIQYSPNLMFRNGHISTMYPFLFRSPPKPNYVRERWNTPDHDFIDVDTILKGSSKAIILLHGLEGSASSQYILGVIASLDQTNLDIYALNHRSCSGEPNLTSTMYHSGFTIDLAMMIDSLSVKYDDIALVGYSLGGNIILKYLGNYPVPNQVKTAIAISVPVDLTSSAVRLNHWSNTPYAIQFLLSLNKKAQAKSKQFPTILTRNNYLNISTLRSYDDIVTAPLHGYEDANDYYLRASSKPELSVISVPTLLINAENDSFLAPPCFPFEIADGHPNFHLLSLKYGGHVGFSEMFSSTYWSDNIVNDWLSKYLETF